MMKHRYGKFSDMQMSEIKKTLRGSIFFLLQCADPNTSTITGDTSFMYALVAIPASLIPTVLSYMKNSRVEHQMGQFENPIETPSVTLDLNNEEENKAAG